MRRLDVGSGDPRVDGVLAVARREILVLAAALQSGDDAIVLLASQRVRWSLAHAHQLAAHSLEAFARARPQLDAVVDAAVRWLPPEARLSLTTRTLRRIAVDLSRSGLQLPSIDASDTLVVSFDLDDLPLSGLTIRSATVAEVSARGARLDLLDATGAKIAKSCFARASIRVGAFDEATVDDCDLSRTNLADTTWRAATVSRCRFVGAVLLDAQFERSHFVECDLRDVDLSLTSGEESAAHEPHVRFTRCDLRGVKWEGRSPAHMSFVDSELDPVPDGPRPMQSCAALP
jgi:uncharacterized protein YjbI with pentapeptide repeats